jgi:hypothetical protein
MFNRANNLIERCLIVSRAILLRATSMAPVELSIILNSSLSLWTAFWESSGGENLYKRPFSSFLSSPFLFFLNGESPETGKFSDFMGECGGGGESSERGIWLQQEQLEQEEQEGQELGQTGAEAEAEAEEEE